MLGLIFWTVIPLALGILLILAYQSITRRRWGTSWTEDSAFTHRLRLPRERQRSEHVEHYLLWGIRNIGLGLVAIGLLALLGIVLRLFGIDWATWRR